MRFACPVCVVSGEDIRTGVLGGNSTLSQEHVPFDAFQRVARRTSLVSTFCTAPCEVMVNDRGLVFPINVTTLSEEVSLKFMATLNSVAVQSGRLQTVWVEECVDGVRIASAMWTSL